MRQNIYGQLVMTQAEQAYIHQVLVSRACPICQVPAGQDCRYKLKRKSGGRWVSMGDRVHMGRVPAGWDSYQVLLAAGYKDEQQPDQQPSGVVS